MQDLPHVTNRPEFIAGLRELADYLDQHPAVPEPDFTTIINVHVAAPEDGGHTQVAQLAGLLEVSVSDRTSKGGHLTATRMFGSIAYTIVSIPAAAMVAHDAHFSYRGCVMP